MATDTIEASAEEAKKARKRASDRASYAKHHEKRLASMREYREARKDDPEFQEARRKAIKKYSDSAKNKERMRAYYLAHQAEFKVRSRQRYAEKKEEILAYQVAYYQARREEILASVKQYREANTDKLRERYAKWRKANPHIMKEWRAANRDKVLANHAKRRARVRGAKGTLTAEDLQRILRSQRGKCAYCRVGIKGKYHADHIMPLARGGAHEPRNIQLLCQPCNQRKHASHPITFAQKLGLLL